MWASSTQHALSIFPKCIPMVSFSSIACVMLATTICFSTVIRFPMRHTAHAMTFNNLFNWFTVRVQIAYERICVRNDLAFVYFKCKHELHVCTYTFVHFPFCPMSIVIAFIWNALLARANRFKWYVCWRIKNWSDANKKYSPTAKANRKWNNNVLWQFKYAIDDTLAYVLLHLYCRSTSDIDNSELKNVSPTERLHFSIEMPRNICWLWINNVFYSFFHFDIQSIAVWSM